MSTRRPDEWDRVEARKREVKRRQGRRRLLVAGIVLVVGAVAVSGYLTNWGRDTAPPPPPPVEPPLTKLVFPEGIRREEMAALLDEKTRLSGARYLELTAPSQRGAQVAGRTRPTSLEGYLFPATYSIGTETTEQFLVDQQIRAFTRTMRGIDMTYATSKNLDRHDVVILASMIEREVRVPAERRIVAGVMYNRLRLGMRLDIDATVQYAKGDWSELTGPDLRSSSPYNTRRFPGLPPGPICSPGEASLSAAANPAQHDYLYYVAKGDGSGRHTFVRTLEEFNRIAG